MDKYNLKESKEIFELYGLIYCLEYLTLDELSKIQNKSKATICDKLTVLRNHKLIVTTKYNNKYCYIINYFKIKELFKTNNRNKIKHYLSTCKRFSDIGKDKDSIIRKIIKR